MENWASPSTVAAQTHLVAYFSSSRAGMHFRINSIRQRLPIEEHFVRTHPAATQQDAQKVSALRVQLASALLDYHAFDALAAHGQDMLESPTPVFASQSRNLIDPVEAAMRDSTQGDSAETATAVRQHLRPDQPAVDTTILPPGQPAVATTII